MKLLRIVAILLIGLLMLPAPALDAARARRKKAKTTAVRQKKSRKRTKTSRSSQKRKALSRRSTRAKVLTAEEYEARRAELRRQDSIRLRIGGTVPLDMGQNVLQVAYIEPLLNRFRKADTTLTRKEIESLYFSRHVAEGDSIFFGQIIPKVDAAIDKEQYAEALRIAEKGLHRNPLHIGLLKRACDLAKHEDSPQLDSYVWQIAELFYLIQHTGDGKTPRTALRVVEEEDALLYEILWLDTIKERIVEQQLSPLAGGQLLTLSIRDPKGGTYKKYYLIA